jgi:hypothetical protein
MRAEPALPVRPPRLSVRRRFALYIIAAGLWLTGTAWLLFHYFLMRETPFGPNPHPLEFWSRAAHGAFGFASLWLFGTLWAAHVFEGWRSLRRRWTGSLMFGLFSWLVLSGYLLYYLGGEELLTATTILHWSIGLAAPVPFLLHRFAAAGEKRTAA